MRGWVSRLRWLSTLGGHLEMCGEVWEAEVLRLLALEKLVLFPRQRPAALHAFRDVQQAREIGAVLSEARLGIVARRPRGDEELPVRRLEEQQFPSHLLDDASQQGHLSP